VLAVVCALLSVVMLLVDQQKLQQPVMYSINCAHPVHFSTVLTEAKEIKAQWLQRLRSVRANASTRSHAELDDVSLLLSYCYCYATYTAVIGICSSSGY
jgi:S-methylmethionine-dependent homocysteine/selenocysteine methylase